MATSDRIPAAQYVRMSTEHQQYSLENQSVANQKYADCHDFEIVRTYTDTARTGAILKQRAGLQQLLQDVVRGPCEFRAILVYDVSRWGRFQDTDEAAHYEFLCKSSGVPVHYCAEIFANDGTLPSLIMKALKRTMAGEYSRELGVKVLAGQKRLAMLGFKQGGLPGYGLRRMLVSPFKVPKQTLALGERKNIATDRVILVPGPDREVQCVRNIFSMLIFEKRTVYAIARELNRIGIPYLNGAEWDYQAVYSILTHPKYIGYAVFARSSRKLYTPAVRLPETQWVLTPGAFEAIVDSQTFQEAQRILRDRTINKSDEEILNSLRRLLASKGTLSLSLIQNSPDTPSPSTYRRRFGGLRQTYSLIGYGHPDQFKSMDLRHRTLALRDEVLTQIVHLFPTAISIVRRSGRWRNRLCMPGGRIVSVLVARAIRSWKDSIRWQVDPHLSERKFVTLLVRLNQDNSGVKDFHVFARINAKNRFRLTLKDTRFQSGILLPALSALPETVERVVHNYLTGL
jgi:DNA invertase Pin-like site-specific DNA recombinase